jgi:hypothetical protein
MKGFLFFLAGPIAGLWVAAQYKAIHLPVFHLPRSIHLDPLALLLVAIALMVLFAMRGKRTGGKP